MSTMLAPDPIRQAAETISYAIDHSSLGAVLVARSKLGLCAILFGEGLEDLRQELAARLPGVTLVPDGSGLDGMVDQVVSMIETPHRPAALPLDPQGTAFQQRVWAALREIPPGQTASYQEIAERIGAPSAVRAVAQACGANLLAVAIPCHRVVRSDGDLGGYRWGVERKRALLAHEQSA